MYRICITIALFLLFAFGGYQLTLVSETPDKEAASYEVPGPLTLEERTRVARHFAQDEIQQLDSTMAFFHSNRNFSGSVLVGKNGKVIYEDQFGVKDINSGDSISADDPFQLASVSKPLTALGIVMLVEEGLVDLDDDVRCYIPEIPYDGITVRNLLNHSGGLPNYMWIVEHYWNEEYPPDNEDVIRLLAEHKLSQHFLPGRRHGYSNTGYVVLASVIERATDMSFADYMRTRIFEPLEMENTFVYSYGHMCEPEGLVKGHRQYRTGRYYSVPFSDLDGPVGDKGIFSTARDLFRWVTALENGELVSDELHTQLYEPLSLRNGNTVRYGMGWRLRFEEQNPYVYHNGLWYGFRSTLRQFREQDKVMIVLNNNNFRNLNHLSMSLEGRLFRDSSPAVADELLAVLFEEGVEHAIAHYQSFREEHDQAGHSKTELDLLKDVLDTMGKEEHARLVDQLIASVYPMDPFNDIMAGSNREADQIEGPGGDY